MALLTRHIKVGQGETVLMMMFKDIVAPIQMAASVENYEANGTFYKIGQILMIVYSQENSS